MKKDKKSKIWWIVGGIILVIIIFPYIFKYLSEKFPTEFKDDKDDAEKKHEELKLRIEKNKKLKIKLSKKFKWIYFVARIFIISLWGLIIYLFYRINWVNNLEDFLNHSEAIILLWITVNFLFSGSFTNHKYLIKLIKVKLENWIWGQYLINLDNDISRDKEELKKLSLN